MSVRIGTSMFRESLSSIWLMKCHYPVMLMGKLTAISTIKAGQLNAISRFRYIWEGFIEYWSHLKLQDNLQRQAWGML